MNPGDKIKQFYLTHLKGAKIEGTMLKASCPFCANPESPKPGMLIVYLDPESFFYGYFRCSNRCKPGGFAPHFGRLLGLDPQAVPGFDPDRSGYVRDVLFPSKNINADIKKFRILMAEPQFNFFNEFGVSKPVLEEMKIGYNGRYLVFPYFQEDGNCYAARCILPEREEDHFWHGDERFFAKEFQVYNVEEVERCEDGALFITDGEKNLLTLKELGFPGIAVPDISSLETLDPERFLYINHIFIVLNNSPEAQLTARGLATRLGFKVRILKWPANVKRDYHLYLLAKEKGKELRPAFSSMLKNAKAFSPFASPDREHQNFMNSLERAKGRELLGFPSGLAKMDEALDGIRGINIMGGQPKAGKSCFFMQVSTEIARRKIPVIYYDFENGRQKIYLRTLCRLSRLAEEELRDPQQKPETVATLTRAEQEFKKILQYFRVVTDRKLSPEIMRRQLDFIQHETRQEACLVVIDSLHKLPFKSLSERRTGIDEWLRHMEAIRDEQNVAFLVISELSRGEQGNYSKEPNLASFKESGDIEYSADNAIILQPDWDPLDPISRTERKSTLWLVASRESSPGKIAEYALDFPYWGFKEL
jgi:KaiC/GvpD/RAD55 family RecA-like ATPase